MRREGMKREKLYLFIEKIKDGKIGEGFYK